MKIIFAVLILLVSMALSAQITLENTYSVSTSICSLEKSGDKYFTMDVANKQCRIYNLDHSLYKTVNLVVPAEYYLYNVQHVSEHLFNQDDLIELVYIYSRYNQTETSYYYSYETIVINELGTELLKVTGAGHTEILETDDMGKKLLVYVYDFYQIPATTQTRVYSLPEAALKSGPIRSHQGMGNPWPNPSAGMVHIPVKLPPNSGPGELILYNLHGQELMRQEVNAEEELLILQEGVLIPGTYVYKVASENGESEGKKITIR